MQLRSLVCILAVSLALHGAALADITGKIKFDGKAPEPRQIDMSAVAECHKPHADPVYDETVVVGENGELANVAVFVKADDPSSLGGDVPGTPAVIDQNGCMYSPHVLVMMVGQELAVKNSDPFLHNVHSLAQQNPAFNFGQPNKDPGKKVDPPKVAENIKVKCDVHPWMGMWIIVLEHPFFAVSGDDGSFTIPGSLPDGDYTLTAWHEKYGTQDVQVSVKDGKGEVADAIVFKDGGAQAEPVKTDVRLASLTTEKKTDAACGNCCPQSDGRAGTMTASASK
jgi:hypothetical protein